MRAGTRCAQGRVPAPPLIALAKNGITFVLARRNQPVCVALSIGYVMWYLVCYLFVFARRLPLG